MQRGARSARIWILVSVLFGALGAWCPAQARSPKDTPLYRQMKIQDPDSLFIPPLILKHVVQLPTPWQDPLRAEAAEPAGPVIRAVRRDRAVEVESERFLFTVSLEGPAVHVVARRKAAPPSAVFPSLALKEPLPVHGLEVVESPEAVDIRAPAFDRLVVRFRRDDASFELPAPHAGAPPVRRFRVAYSREDSRIHVLADMGVDEHVYGLGMKTGTFDRRDQRYIMWNSDTYGYHEDKDPLYASVPFFVMTDGTGRGSEGVFVDDASDVVFDFGHTYPGRLDFSTVNGQAAFYVFTAPRLAAVLAAYQALTGVFPLPPAWALGYHQSAHTYFPADRVLEIARTFRDRDIPCDALYLDIIHQDGYRPFTWNGEHFPDPAGMIRRLHDLDFRVLTIVDPGIKVDEDYPVFREGRAKGFFLRTADGQLYANNIWPGYSVFPDFLQEDCRRWWSRWHGVYLRQGVDAFKNDMSEPATFNKTWSMLYYDEQTPLPGFLTEGTLDENVVSRSRGFGALAHRAFHNVYGLYESMATWQAQADWDDRRPFVLMRNTFASGQKYTYLWTGDILSNWSSLRLSIELLLNLNLSGFPICGADNGGFGGRCTPELFLRWTQFSTFAPFFRTHYFYVEQTLDKEPWAYGPEAEAIAARYIRLRYRLLPYLYTSVWNARARRAPLMQPLFLRYESDPQAYAAEAQYLWGDDFLVAPVVEPAARGRQVYLPAGRWYDFWSGQATVSAGQWVFVPAPLDRIPVFVRAGRIIPTMDPAPTTAAFPPQTMILDAYLEDGAAAGELYLDDGTTRQHIRGDWAQCRFRVAVEDEALVLTMDHRGRDRFLPRTLKVRAFGAAGVRILRWQGREYALDQAGDVAGAAVPLKP